MTTLMACQLSMQGMKENVIKLNLHHVERQIKNNKRETEKKMCRLNVPTLDCSTTDEELHKKRKEQWRKRKGRKRRGCFLYC